ncbi:MFS transporter [Streptacidiphilus jiangxiensis]|uniref:Drug resistance transporter, EmrB/QacA subfamily n=1 Tax=Streptacidiphilus jiangxiensis TaxID=235985 RepID=A0A1H7FJN5_STRJI|nr:MFS transporter [Streptacidiphilus jiangxiensis]SEK26306.1 drug resistance transporter, EmrB/QacA subfamily [Streptacidiphilus jiangxiensis]
MTTDATTSTTKATDADSSPPDRRRWWALAAVCLSVLVLGFDGTILNVALPDMAIQLHATTGQLQWIVDAYLVVFAAAMLPAGLLGDRFGRRRLLIGGLVLFGVASLVGTLANSADTLIAVRAVMGLGGAFIMPLGIAILPSLFAPAERPRAVAAMTAGMAVGMPLGPMLGGLLLNHFWWGSIFLINVPLIAIGIVACLWLVPESTDPSVPRIDVLGAVVGVLGLGALTFGIIQGPSDGWGSAQVLASLTAAVVLLGGLVRRERSQPHPMVDFTLLADRVYRWSTVASVLVSFVMMGGLFVLPQYLQSVLGHDALGTGVRLMPLMAGLLVAARAAERLVARLSVRWVVAAGMLVVATSMLLGASTSVGDGYGRTALWLSLLGVGMGFTMVPAMGAAMAALPEERAGVGSGLLQTLRQSASAIGVALLGSLLASAYTARLDTGSLPAAAAAAARGSVSAAQALAQKLPDAALGASAHAAFVHGMDLVLLACGIGAALSAALIAWQMPGAVPGGAESEA